MKYKFNMDKWLANNSKTPDEKEILSKQLSLIINSNKAAKERLAVPIMFEKNTHNQNIDLEDRPGFEVSIVVSKADCDVVKDKIISEKDYKFLKALEDFYEKEIRSFTLDHLYLDMKRVNITFKVKEVGDSYGLKIQLDTTGFSNFETDVQLSRQELMGDWD